MITRLFYLGSAAIFLSIAWITYRGYKKKYPEPFQYYFRKSDLYAFAMFLLFPITAFVYFGYASERMVCGVLNKPVKYDRYKLEYKARRMHEKGKLNEKELQNVIKGLDEKYGKRV